MKLRYTAIFFILPFVQPAIAHHSSSPHFDADKPITIEGVVTEFRFVNPHAYLYLDVTNADGAIETWNCEIDAASSMKRRGWTADLFEPGMQVTIDGVAARRDPLGCSYVSGILPDGTIIPRREPIDRSAPVAVEEDAEPAEDSKTIAGNWEPPRREGRRRGGQPGQPRESRGAEGVGRDGPPQQRRAPEMTEAGKAAQADFDPRFDDPGLECSPSSIIRVWFETGMVNQIEVLDDKVFIRHEFMDLERTVHLTAQKPPDGYVPGLTGFSTGHFADGDLVIETIGFKAGVLQAHAGGGMLHTDKMHVAERLRLSDDGNQLTRDYVVTDPDYYVAPITGSQTWQRSNRALPRFNCVELSGVSKERPEEE